MNVQCITQHLNLMTCFSDSLSGDIDLFCDKLHNNKHNILTIVYVVKENYSIDKLHAKE